MLLICQSDVVKYFRSFGDLCYDIEVNIFFSYELSG